MQKFKATPLQNHSRGVADGSDWNALIRGYLNQGQARKVLNIFDSIYQYNDIHLVGPTFVALLRACTKLKDVYRARKIHNELFRRGLLQTDVYVGSALVDTYSKCGALAKAEEVFDLLPVRNVVSWTTLITGYVEHGHGDKAIHCFQQMQHEGISSDVVTLVCSLKACSITGSRELGKELHVDLTMKGMEWNPSVGSTLVDMYAKCGSLAEAQMVFDKLPVRNVVSWTALIAGYTDHGHGKEALDCLDQMQSDGVDPDAVTYMCGLKACSVVKCVDRAYKVHKQICRQGLERNLVVGSTLVDMYAKLGLVRKAREVFDKLAVRDVVVWTALLSAYAEHGEGEELLNCFQEMQDEGISPGPATYVCGLKGCSSTGDIRKGKKVYIDITKKGLEKELLVGNTLIDLYAKCGSLVDAHKVLIELPVRDVISWTALITGHAQLGESENVFQVFDKMVGENIQPNLATFVNVLSACSHAGSVEKGEKYFESMFIEYGLIPTVEHYTCVIDLFGRAGCLDRVINMITKMPFRPGIVVWHALLASCRKWGNVAVGRLAFEYALLVDERDTSSYVTMFNIYTDASMHEEANKIEALRLERKSLMKSEKMPCG